MASLTRRSFLVFLAMFGVRPRFETGPPPGELDDWRFCDVDWGCGNGVERLWFNHDSVGIPSLITRLMVWLHPSKRIHLIESEPGKPYPITTLSLFDRALHEVCEEQGVELGALASVSDAVKAEVCSDGRYLRLRDAGMSEGEWYGEKPVPTPWGDGAWGPNTYPSI